MFFGKGLKLGKIGGISIEVDYSWFIIFGLFVFLLASAYLPVVAPGLNGVWYWSTSIFTTLLFFGSVLGHELSHAIVARRNGIPVNSITLFIFGGVAQMEDEPLTPFDEFKMAIAGPLASVGMAVIFFGVSMVFGALDSRIFFAVFTYLWFINLVLAVFNMLPGFPLDGGRVFRALVWRITGNLLRATKIASVTGQAFGWVFIALGVGSLVFPPLRQFGSIWLALIGWFLVSAARNSYQQLLVKDALVHVPISEVMNPRVESVPPDMPVERLVTEYFLRESASTLPVERDGQLIGMVSVEDVRAIPREKWAFLHVQDIIVPLSEEQIVHPQDDAWDAANRMARANRDRVLVTEDGHVEGIVTRGAIARWLQVHSRMATGEA